MDKYIMLDDFIDALKSLDDKISTFYNTDKPLELKVFGGFTMLYYGLRKNNTTKDIDTLTYKFSEELISAIQRVAVEKNLPYDWLNNSWFTWNGYDMSLFNWACFENTIYKFKNIILNVATLDTILILKVKALENKRIEDLDDIIAILNTYGIYNSDNLDKRNELKWIENEYLYAYSVIKEYFESQM